MSWAASPLPAQADQGRVDLPSPQLRDGTVEWREMAVAERVLGKADPNATERTGWSALHAAACLMNVSLVERLLNLGADKSAKLSANHSFVGQTFAAGSTPADVAMTRKIAPDWQDVQKALVERLG